VSNIFSVKYGSIGLRFGDHLGQDGNNKCMRTKLSPLPRGQSVTGRVGLMLQLLLTLH